MLAGISFIWHKTPSWQLSESNIARFNFAVPFASLLLFSQVAPQNLVNVTHGLISVVSRNPTKHFLRFFKNISSVILLKVSHSYIRLMMENSDCGSHEKTGLFCLF